MGRPCRGARLTRHARYPSRRARVAAGRTTPAATSRLPRPRAGRDHAGRTAGCDHAGRDHAPLTVQAVRHAGRDRAGPDLPTVGLSAATAPTLTASATTGRAGRNAAGPRPDDGARRARFDGPPGAWHPRPPPIHRLAMPVAGRLATGTHRPHQPRRMGRPRRGPRARPPRRTARRRRRQIPRRLGPQSRKRAREMGSRASNRVRGRSVRGPTPGWHRCRNPVGACRPVRIPLSPLRPLPRSRRCRCRSIPARVVRGCPGNPSTRGAEA
jgi:hypothetical protein